MVFCAGRAVGLSLLERSVWGVRGWGKREPCSCWGQRSGKSVFIANGMLNFRDGVSGPLVSLSTVYSY